MTLLSRLAETVFWMGRYVERAEDLARAIWAHEALCLDLPDEWAPDWLSLCEYSGSSPIGDELQAERRWEQDAVLQFLVTAESNPGSVVNAVRQARDNLRRCRAVVPREAWTTLSAVHERLLGASRAHATMSHDLDEVVRASQQVSAQISATMSHDTAYCFWRAGRYVERANMVARITAASCASRLRRDAGGYDGARWGELLHAVGAYQMYRRAHHGRANESDALRFVLGDSPFPRSFRHCLGQVARELSSLPNGSRLSRNAATLGERAFPTQAGAALAFADSAIAEVANLSEAIEAQYFHTTVETAPRAQAVSIGG